MNEQIDDLLDFPRPNVGYQDSDGTNVCGCCGTYYVLENVGEVEHIGEVVNDLYVACKGIVDWFEQQGFDRELPQFRTLQAALAKAERK